MATDDKKEAQQPKNPGSTGPMDIPREPGQDRPPTPDELPVGQRAPRKDVNADRRRSRKPYPGAERRVR